MTATPATQAGRDLDSATFHSPKCDKSALMDGACTCGWTVLIVRCEREASASAGALREAAVTWRNERRKRAFGGAWWDNALEDAVDALAAQPAAGSAEP